MRKIITQANAIFYINKKKVIIVSNKLITYINDYYDEYLNFKFYYTAFLIYLFIIIILICILIIFVLLY